MPQPLRIVVVYMVSFRWSIQKTETVTTEIQWSLGNPEPHTPDPWVVQTVWGQVESSIVYH